MRREWIPVVPLVLSRHAALPGKQPLFIEHDRQTFSVEMCANKISNFQQPLCENENSSLVLQGTRINVISDFTFCLSISIERIIRGNEYFLLNCFEKDMQADK